MLRLPLRRVVSSPTGTTVTVHLRGGQRLVLRCESDLLGAAPAPSPPRAPVRGGFNSCYDHLLLRSLSLI